jgi:hypothetical protein
LVRRVGLADRIGGGRIGVLASQERLIVRRLLVLCLLTWVWSGGCQDALLPDNAPRTQYERYDRVRGNHAPAERVGQYGEPAPALRERLRPYR